MLNSKGQSNAANQPMPKLRKVSELEKPIYNEKLNTGVTLYVAPRTVVPWKEFIRHAPPYSIGLDGMVYGRPRFSEKGPHANFNHHEEVDRLGTRATCAQILVALKQGLLDRYREDGMPKLNIFVNDPDQDTSLAVWLLNNHERVVGPKSEPLVNKIVGLEDLLDTTAGAYPQDPNTDTMRELNWVFDPYNQARVANRIFKMGAPEMANVISAVGERISRYTLGHAEQLPLDTTFDRIGGGTNWTMVREIGSAARTGLYHEGIKAFVAVRENDDGTFSYSIGKLSPFIDFPLTDLYSILDEAEGIDSKASDRWGGSDIIGGSPRQGGSKLSPKELETIINGLLTSSD